MASRSPTVKARRSRRGMKMNKTMRFGNKLCEWEGQVGIATRRIRMRRQSTSRLFLVCVLVACTCLSMVEASTSVSPPSVLSRKKHHEHHQEQQQQQQQQGRKRSRQNHNYEVTTTSPPAPPSVNKKHTSRKRRANKLEKALTSIQNDFNFKGFGWTFYKSLIFKTSFGAAFNIPMTFNFDMFERRPFLPSLSSSLCFFYPWSVIFFINLSLPCELLRHVLYLSVAYTQRILLLLVLFVTGSKRDMEVPPFQPLPLRYSKNVQERLGASISWRVSVDRGYEFRYSTWYMYLPTLECMMRMGAALFTKLENKWLGLDQKQQTHTTKPAATSEDTSDYDSEELDLSDLDDDSSSAEEDISKLTSSASTTKPSPRHRTRRRKLQLEQRQQMLEWLRQRTASMGMSAGGPIPDAPYYYTSVLLSLSGFQYVSLMRDYLAKQKRSRLHQQHQQQQKSRAAANTVKRKKVLAAGTPSSMAGATTGVTKSGVATPPKAMTMSGAERVSSVHVGGGSDDAANSSD